MNVGVAMARLRLTGSHRRWQASGAVRRLEKQRSPLRSATRFAQRTLEEIANTEHIGGGAEIVELHLLALDTQDANDIAPLPFGDFAAAAIPAQLLGHG